jgi:ankyrin repeat protein
MPPGTFEQLMKKACDRPEDVERYLQAGGDVNRRTQAGHSLLHLAADNGVVDLIRLLIARGADINAKGYHGYTPLHLAVDVDCNTESRDGRRATALPVTETLIQLGADETIRDDDGETARDVAITYGEGEVVLYDALPRRQVDTP